MSPDGTTLYVTGSASYEEFDSDYTTIAYDTSTGTGRWAARYDGPASFPDTAYSLGVSPDGTHVYVTGVSHGGASGDDYTTIAYDASTGAEQWVARYDGPTHGTDWAYSLGVSPDGTRVFVTGWSSGESGYADYATVAYSVN